MTKSKGSVVEAATAKTGHTAGPWAFTEGDAERRDMSTIHKAGDKDFIIGYAVTESFNMLQRAEDLANGRLFAAAPDLLAACESMLRTCGSSADWQGETRESLLLIEAAIRKAKGA